MTFVIDGTNLVRRLYQESRRISLTEEEGHIESFLEWVGWMSARHRRGARRFRVVFDGPPRRSSTAEAMGLRLYWGKEEGADAVILDQVRYLTHERESSTVVTADRALAEAARREGAGWMRPEEFFRRLNAGTRSSG